MSDYSQGLKNAVMDYVNAEKEYGVIPIEMALANKEFPKEYKRYHQDSILSEHFLVLFEDIIKIIDEQENPDEH